jgi:hypothetical protein
MAWAWSVPDAGDRNKVNRKKAFDRALIFPSRRRLANDCMRGLQTSRKRTQHVYQTRETVGNANPEITGLITSGGDAMIGEPALKRRLIALLAHFLLRKQDRRM